MKPLPRKQIEVNLISLLIEKTREDWPEADINNYADLAGMFLAALEVSKCARMRGPDSDDYEFLGELKIGRGRSRVPTCAQAWNKVSNRTPGQDPRKVWSRSQAKCRASTPRCARTYHYRLVHGSI